MKRAGKGTRAGVAQRRSDLADLERRVVEQLPGDLETAFVDKLMETSSGSLQSSTQRANVQREQRSHLIFAAMTSQ